MTMTRFTPIHHGFQFSNRAIHWSWGLLAGRNLCGGMSFASLDYFYHGMGIPPVRHPPEQGEPLHDYIYARQMHAHRFAMPTLLQGMSRWGRNELAVCMRGSGYEALRRSIDRGRPTPILLGDPNNALSANSHWVVAIGYDGDADRCTRVVLYDNNYPNGLCDLVPDEVAGLLRHRRGLTYTGTVYAFFVPFLDYLSADPRVPLGDASVAPAIVNPFGLTPPGSSVL